MEVKIVNDKLIFQYDGIEKELKHDEIALIGEFATEVCPFAEDHFIMFFSKNGDIFEISLGKFIEIKDALSEKLNANLEPSLNQYNSFQSRVFYPDGMKDKIIWVPQANNDLLGKVKSIFKFSEKMILNKELIEFIDNLNCPKQAP